jgi:hypothetical protein
MAARYNGQYRTHTNRHAHTHTNPRQSNMMDAAMKGVAATLLGSVNVICALGQWP